MVFFPTRTEWRRAAQPRRPVARKGITDLISNISTRVRSPVSQDFNQEPESNGRAATPGPHRRLRDEDIEGLRLWTICARGIPACRRQPAERGRRLDIERSRSVPLSAATLPATLDPIGSSCKPRGSIYGCHSIGRLWRLRSGTPAKRQYHLRLRTVQRGLAFGTDRLDIKS